MEKLNMVRKKTSRNEYAKIKKNEFEQAAWDKQQVICGIDEVGRGCLAGPLVTAAVILPVNKTSRLIKDSKLLNEPERLKAYKWITKHCWYSYGIVNNRIIDKYNIWQATLIAMKKALMHLLAISPRIPSTILVDAMPLQLFDTHYKDIPIHYFPFSERKSSSIAAASIIAKVKRDGLMGKFDAIFPGYHLAQHKGYGTKKHKNVLSTEQQHSIIHRLSFLNNIDTIDNTDNDDYGEQKTLC